MAEAQTSFVLARQLHFLAHTPDVKDAVITVQQWTKRTGTRPGGIYVVCVNGVEANRRNCTDAKSVAELTRVMDETQAKHADSILSEEAAATEVRRRKGPELTWCHRTKTCDAPVPYASAVCAYGHPTESVGRIQFASVRSYTLATGGQNRG